MNLVPFAPIVVMAALSAAATKPAPIPSPAAAPEITSVPAFLAEHPLPAGEVFRSDAATKGASSTVAVAQVRGALKAHHHARTEETVYLVSGSGTLTLGERSLPMKAGDLVRIPIGVRHAFMPDGGGTAVAISFFSPAFDGTDRIFESSPK